MLVERRWENLKENDGRKTVLEINQSTSNYSMNETYKTGMRNQHWSNLNKGPELGFLVSNCFYLDWSIVSSSY